jgi:hypothetical protein
MEQFQHVMTSGKKVNKTDSENLAAQFGVSYLPCTGRKLILVVQEHLEAVQQGPV